MRSVIFTLIVLMAVPAFAEVSQNGSVYVTTNTDIDTAAEQIAASGPTACSQVKVCYLKSSNNVAYVVEASSLSTPQKAVVNTFGFPLYPVATSGETCLTVNATNVNAKGKYTPINSRNFWAASGGSDSKVSLVCQKW